MILLSRPSLGSFSVRILGLPLILTSHKKHFGDVWVAGGGGGGRDQGQGAGRSRDGAGHSRGTGKVRDRVKGQRQRQRHGLRKAKGKGWRVCRTPLHMQGKRCTDP